MGVANTATIVALYQPRCAVVVLALRPVNPPSQGSIPQWRRSKRVIPLLLQAKAQDPAPVQLPTPPAHSGAEEAGTESGCGPPYCRCAGVPRHALIETR